RARGRLAAGGLPGQGQRRLDALPRSGQRVLRPDRGRGVVRHRGGRRGRRLRAAPVPAARRVLTDAPSLAGEPATSEGVGGLARFRLDIAYDGTEFSGWARQPGRRTVCAVLEETLSQVLRERIRL